MNKLVILLIGFSIYFFLVVDLKNAHLIVEFMEYVKKKVVFAIPVIQDQTVKSILTDNLIP